MRFNTKVLLICLTGMLFSSQSNAVLIDFETLPGGASITAEVGLTNQFASLGITFSATENGVAVTPTIQSPAVFFGEPAFSGTNYADNQIVGLGPDDTTSRADVFTMSFLNSANNVSFYVDPKGSGQPVFNAYDAANMLLETLTVNLNGWNLWSFTSTNISRIEGIQPSDSWNYGIDDLSFTAAVPEPATLALMGLGLAGLGFTRRKKA